jgi:hypothetical protein
MMDWVAQLLRLPRHELDNNIFVVRFPARSNFSIFLNLSQIWFLAYPVSYPVYDSG